MTYSKTILCVENDRDSYELLRFMLEMEDFQVVTCDSSEEGLKLALQNAFAAIVLETRLADMSGVEICSQIRARNQKTPIVFYTASAYPKDRAAGLAAGANDYLVKPNDLERIAGTIKGLIS